MHNVYIHKYLNNFKQVNHSSNVTQPVAFVSGTSSKLNF